MTPEVEDRPHMTVDQVVQGFTDLRELSIAAIGDIGELLLWAGSIDPTDIDTQLGSWTIRRVLRDREGLV